MKATRMSKEQLNQVRLLASMQPINNPARVVVFQLLGHIEAVEWEKEALVKTSMREAVANERLAENVAQLQRELQENREGRKVAVPRDVADAIEYLRGLGIDNDEIIRLSMTTYRLSSCPKRIQLGRYAIDYPDTTARAIINGYTVEQTPDDYVEQEYRSFLSKGDGSAAAAVELVLSIFGKNELLHRLRNEVH